jgi:hypothetical protein
VAAGSPFKSVQDIVAKAKEKAGSLSYGTSGVRNLGTMLATVEFSSFKMACAAARAGLGEDRSREVEMENASSAELRYGLDRQLRDAESATEITLLPSFPRYSHSIVPGGFEVMS